MSVSAASLARVKLKVIPNVSVPRATSDQIAASANVSAYMNPWQVKQSITGNAELATFTPDGTGAVARTVQSKIRERISVTDYGAVADGKTVTDGAISASTSTFTSATAAFTSADAGKLIVVQGAGASGAPLATTIAGYTNATTVTLTAPAATTVSGATMIFGTDNAAAIQKAADVVSANGGALYFPPVLNRDYCIASQITLSVSTVSIRPYIDVGSNIHFASNNRIDVVSDGAVVTAMAVMDQMFKYSYHSPLNNPAPLYSEFMRLNVNCNNLAARGIWCDYMMHTQIARNAIWDPTLTCIDISGRGVAFVLSNVMRGPRCITIGENANFGGGDTIIDGNDLYVSGSGVVMKGWSGNTAIQNNTFNREGSGSIIGVDIDATTPSDGSRGANDIAVNDNEFRGFDKAVKGVRSSSARNVYNLRIEGNHTNFYGVFGFATIADLNGIDDAEISRNFLGYSIGADVSGVGAILADCRRVKVTGNIANNLTDEFVTLTDCLDCIVSENILRNVKKSSAAGSLITLAVSTGSTLRNEVSRNHVIQGSGSYGQTFVSEGASSDYTLVILNTLTGTTTEATLVGANSVRLGLGLGLSAGGVGLTASSFGFRTAGGLQFAIANTTSAVNYAQAYGAGAGGAVTFGAAGADTDIWVNIQTKGAGIIQLIGHSRLATGKFLQRTQSAGLTATGTTQGTALALTSDINGVTTTASGSGVILSSSQREVVVANAGANALSVYPPSGAQINALGTNNPFSVAAGQVGRFFSSSATQWYA